MIFHDLLISHLIIIDFIINKTNGFLKSKHPNEKNIDINLKQLQANYNIAINLYIDLKAIKLIISNYKKVW